MQDRYRVRTVVAVGLSGVFGGALFHAHLAGPAKRTNFQFNAHDRELPRSRRRTYRFPPASLAVCLGARPTAERNYYGKTRLQSREQFREDSCSRQSGRLTGTP